ncbi:uncharacterized protein LOC123205686 [Mangifera indica]|uniref:uncharacterized protein LOC123205686 n=1 Tax=Mangifera indica TaxID=29780 RepID=UPI001CFAB221|nr:uncharacterized protein LOC123205686 [Mangifera indica]
MVLELFPPGHHKVWEEWNLQVMLLLSLVLQIALLFLGNRRKYSHHAGIKFVVWSAYLGADAIVTSALNIIWDNLSEFKQKKCPSIVDAKTELTSFWAPFVLLHLGGPDTITAYALEDNELWLRRFANLVAHSITIMYVWISLGSSPLSVLFVLMFCAGVIKYGERILALRSAANNTLRQKLREPRQGYREYSEQKFNMIREEKSEEGYFVGVDITNAAKELPLRHTLVSNCNLPSERDKLQVAYELEKVTLSLILDSTLNFGLRDRVHSLFRRMSAQNAFRVIEMELGLVYDRLYTMTALIYNPCIFILRLIGFLLTCFVFLFFTFLQGKDKYAKIDICITFLLLAVAIFIDIYSALVILSSDRFFSWLYFDKKVSTSKFRIWFQPSKSPRWSNKMRQMSFLRRPMKLRSLRHILKLRRFDELVNFEQDYLRSYKEISEDFKKSVFQYFKEKAATNQSLRGTEGGDWMVREAPKYEQDPAKAILFWHVITEVSFYLDRDGRDTKEQFTDIVASPEISRMVSRYMCYLLVKHPSMVLVGITQASFQMTAKKARKSVYLNSTKTEACIDLVRHINEEDQTLLEALSCIKRMKEEKKDLQEKWKMLREIWMEIMGNAAKKCKGREHRQQLRNGGELLTHVWLLIAHFGLTDHFQISDQHHCANLISK